MYRKIDTKILLGGYQAKDSIKQVMTLIGKQHPNRDDWDNKQQPMLPCEFYFGSGKY